MDIAYTIQVKHAILVIIILIEPTYLKHVIEALNNELVDHDTFEVMLMTLKEQWMGYVCIICHSQYF